MTRTSTLTNEDRARGGRTTIMRYGADHWAGRARKGIVARYLREDGLDPAKMSPEDLEAYTRQAYARGARHATEARSRLAAMRKAAREEAAKQNTDGEPC